MMCVSSLVRNPSGCVAQWQTTTRQQFFLYQGGGAWLDQLDALNSMPRASKEDIGPRRRLGKTQDSCMHATRFAPE